MKRHHLSIKKPYLSKVMTSRQHMSLGKQA